ncbi:ABC transporter ATP-binding protein [Clostridioides difficile]|nr:ABC transporter ATP-binding protein [Clostridioides difficile]
MIELKKVMKKYKEAIILRDFTCTIQADGIYCLLGRNGAGKTTLLKSIAGYQNISSGSIYVNGGFISTATMDTSVSYIDNFAKHFNIPVKKLIKIAGKLNPSFDNQFAIEMMERFELDGSKKFNKLSLGMKTMVSTIICLSSNKPVILLDEPVLGFDAIMRAEFYSLLTESFSRKPRIIIVSTHIIDEIAKVMQKLIIIDRGALCFFDTLQVIKDKAYSVSGPKQEVEEATKDLNIIGNEQVGGFLTRHIFDVSINSESLNIEEMSLQDFFIYMVGRKEVI